MAVLVRLCWPPVLYLRQVRVVALGLFPESCGWLSRVLSNDVHWPVISDNVWRTCPLGPPEHCCVWLRLQRSGFLWSCLVPCFYQKWCQNLVILNPLLFFFSLVVLLFALLLLEPVWGGKGRHMACSLVCESVGKACGSHVDLLSSGLCWINWREELPSPQHKAGEELGWRTWLLASWGTPAFVWSWSMALCPDPMEMFWYGARFLLSFFPRFVWCMKWASGFYLSLKRFIAFWHFLWQVHQVH